MVHINLVKNYDQDWEFNDGEIYVRLPVLICPNGLEGNKQKFIRLNLDPDDFVHDTILNKLRSFQSQNHDVLAEGTILDNRIKVNLHKSAQLYSSKRKKIDISRDTICPGCSLRVLIVLTKAPAKKDLVKKRDGKEEDDDSCGRHYEEDIEYNSSHIMGHMLLLK